jgi:hypothetical protein
MRKIKPIEFKKIVLEKPGVVMLTLRTKTIPDMRKTDNPYYGHVHKITKTNGRLKSDYEKEMQRATGEPGFEAHPHKWAAVVDAAFSTHRTKGGTYLRYIEKSRREYYFYKGKPIAKEMIEPYLRSQDQPVKFRGYNLDNILAVRYGGETLVMKEG